MSDCPGQTEALLTSGGQVRAPWTPWSSAPRSWGGGGGPPKGASHFCYPHNSRTTPQMKLELNSNSQPGPLMASYTFKLGVIPLGTVIVFMETVPSNLNIANVLERYGSSGGFSFLSSCPALWPQVWLRAHDVALPSCLFLSLLKRVKNSGAEVS